MVAHDASRFERPRCGRARQGVKAMPMFTLDETIDHLNRRGFTGHFGVTAGGLRELRTGVTFRADELRICDCFRFEGASDPGDMAIVYAIESRTGVRGTLVDAFGVYADPAISDFITRVAIGQRAVSRDRGRAA
jgi:hypothetical protein